MVHTPVRSLPLVDLGYSTALLTDQYELTMLQAALRSGTAGRRAAFEVFARRLPTGRRYGVVAGVGRLLEALGEFRFGERELRFLTSRGIVDEPTAAWLADYRFSGDIWGYPEGECYFPGSPIMVVEATFGEAVLLETLVLSVLNHDSAIASAASRMVNAAGGRPMIEMGSRRTHEAAAIAAARAAYLAGFANTSNLAAGLRYGVPTAGTSAHAFTLLHDSERHAFKAQLTALGKGTTLLVDTYDVERAVRTAVELAGPSLGAVRIDSGDLAAMARRVRALLDSLDAHDTRIVVTGDLDEYGIAALAAAPADAYGVGTSLVTGSGAPTASLVYKLVARADSEDPRAPMRPVAKRSVGKPSRGGRKSAVRRLDGHGVACAEVVSTGPPIDRASSGPRDRPLLVPLVKGGVVVGGEPLEAARERHAAAVRELPATALQLSAGDPAIPTEFVNGGPSAAMP
ncbi:nicotinate phosphoribosyltransferase [Thermomonospora echinospora]|uniref:Nicotinate phosphoribosyltransferase n=1 Tax=Thermomonospora echinospora TaxID=1992 RepID=A0A1H5VTV4_9ACTN|nr:nicotinate phosphoribosyltransferase [Thermomonospora echinospora]SEF90388.1 nicotinate phosphoribosyltransferase [Thermomonospora echinospora]